MYTFSSKRIFKEHYLFRSFGKVKTGMGKAVKLAHLGFFMSLDNSFSLDILIKNHMPLIFLVKGKNIKL